MSEEEKKFEDVVKAKEGPNLTYYSTFLVVLDGVLQLDDYEVTLSFRLNRPIRCRVRSMVPMLPLEAHGRVTGEAVHAIKVVRSYDGKRVPVVSFEPTLYEGRMRLRRRRFVGGPKKDTNFVEYQFEEVPS